MRSNHLSTKNTTRLVAAGLGLALAFGTAGCKKAQVSKTLNVDALTNMAVERKQICGPKAGDKIADALSAKVKKIDKSFDELTKGSVSLTGKDAELKRILLAVPDLMLDAIIERHIPLRLVSKVTASTECNLVLVDQSKLDKTLQDQLLKMNDQLRTCVRPVKDKAPPEIFMTVEPDLSFAHAAMLPAFTYAFDQTFIAALGRVDASKEAHDNIEQLKINLVYALIKEDLKDKKDVLDGYTKLFGDYENSQAFRDFVFAEAVDSYYCSKETYDHFAGNDVDKDKNPFAHTFAAFEGSDKSAGLAHLFGKAWHSK